MTVLIPLLMELGMRMKRDSVNFIEKDYGAQEKIHVNGRMMNHE